MSDGWRDFWEEARNADILAVAQGVCHAKLKKTGAAEFEGPCPGCGGDDRFGVNTKKRVFNCRVCGAKGSNIDLVMLATGCSKIEAAEKITGRSRPNGLHDETHEERNKRLSMDAQRLTDLQKREEEDRAAEAAKTKRDEEAIDATLDRALDLDHPLAAHGRAYFAARSLMLESRLVGDILFVPDLGYWGARGNGSGEIAHLATLPAIVAVISDFSNATIGLSRLYLDPMKPGEKWVYEPERHLPPKQRRNPSRKILGDKKGGMICLEDVGTTLGLAEGWENAIAFRQLNPGLGVTIAAAIDLGNLSGGATGTIEVASFKDERGLPLRVQNGIPDPNKPGVILPECVKSLIIIADNDSEPLALQAHILTAVRRFLAMGVTVTIFWPPAGLDFNDVLLGKNPALKYSPAAEALRHPGGPETSEAFIERVAFLFDPPEEAAWPVRKPIVAELKPVPAFDADALLPEPLRTWVTDEAERMPCPADYIAAPVAVGLGAIIGAHCAIKPKTHDPWLIVPNLWGGSVGNPGEKKSPGYAAALSPMGPLIAKADEEYAAALQDYNDEKAIFGAQRDGMKDRIRDAARKADRGDAPANAKAFCGQEPQKPTLRRYKTNDPTVEKIGELLCENPAGLLHERDELVGMVSTWDRQGREGDRAFFLEAWNGNQSFDVDRIGRGHIKVPNVCVSIFGCIQPDKLTKYLEQAVHSLANDGMLQRFQVLVYPDPRRWEYRDRAPNRAARDAVFAIFDRLSTFEPVTWGAAAADDRFKFPHFSFGAEAQRVYIQWAADLHTVRMAKEDDPIVRQHLSKYDKLFPALALIFHLVDCAARGVGGPVTKEAALRAAAWCEYLEAHARRCYGLLQDDGLRAAQTLAKKLERSALPDGFTARDVRQHDWRNLMTDEAVQAALEWLEDAGWIRGEVTGGTGPGGGRRTTRYRLHPDLADTKQTGDVRNAAPSIDPLETLGDA